MSTFDNLVDAVGRTAAEKLVADFGGRRLYVPIHPAAGNPIAASIGLDASIALSRRFGGEFMQFPLDSEWGKRRPRICALKLAGMSTAEIARQVGCSRQYVLRVLNTSKAASGEMKH
jgi:hypothetical protein